ncbi:MAG: hypothetical protein ABI907_03605 [Ramlibacter sp.]
MQYTVSMSSRMLAIAGLCIFLLCVLLFLLGIELGKRFTEPSFVAPTPPISMPAAPSAPAVTVPAAGPATSFAKP